MKLKIFSVVFISLIIILSGCEKIPQSILEIENNSEKSELNPKSLKFSPNSDY